MPTAIEAIYLQTDGGATRVAELWWQLGSSCAKSWAIGFPFPTSYLLTFIFFLCKIFYISFGICFVVHVCTNGFLKRSNLCWVDL